MTVKRKLGVLAPVLALIASAVVTAAVVSTRSKGLSNAA